MEDIVESKKFKDNIDSDAIELHTNEGAKV
jgi:hypothetical protein